MHEKFLKVWEEIEEAIKFSGNKIEYFEYE